MKHKILQDQSIRNRRRIKKLFYFNMGDSHAEDLSEMAKSRAFNKVTHSKKGFSFLFLSAETK